MEDDRLASHHVVVTGGARGIGRGIAMRVAKAGADVSVFDTDIDSARETARKVRSRGSEANTVEVDVSDPDSVEAGVAEAVGHLGPIHGLVNNAGVQNAIPILKTTEEDWDFHLDVNAKGTFLCSKAVPSICSMMILRELS